MSHQDAVTNLPKGFQVIASTKDSKYTIIENKKIKSLEYNFTQKLHIQIMENKYSKIFYFQFVKLKKTGYPYQKKKRLVKEIKTTSQK